MSSELVFNIRDREGNDIRWAGTYLDGDTGYYVVSMLIKGGAVPLIKNIMKEEESKKNKKVGKKFTDTSESDVADDEVSEDDRSAFALAIPEIIENTFRVMEEKGSLSDFVKRILTGFWRGSEQIDNKNFNAMSRRRHIEFLRAVSEVIRQENFLGQLYIYIQEMKDQKDKLVSKNLTNGLTTK